MVKKAFKIFGSILGAFGIGVVAIGTVVLCVAFALLPYILICGTIALCVWYIFG